MARPSDSVMILGARVDAVSTPQLIQRALAPAALHRPYRVMYANVHVLNTAWTDPELMAILNAADLVYCDGAGVALGAWLLGCRLPGRMTGADWIEPLCAACADRGVSLYFLGGRPGVAAGAADALTTRFPGLAIAGTHHGYLADPEASAAAIADVNAARPHILLVGMGTPTQEKWITAHHEQLQVPVVWVVGALFDFVTHVQPRGPRWMLNSGLEWLYRLASDPRRLWRRYLIGNPLFVLRVLRQRWLLSSLTRIDKTHRMG